jgi:hypothetical protein
VLHDNLPFLGCHSSKVNDIIPGCAQNANFDLTYSAIILSFICQNNLAATSRHMIDFEE